MSTPRACRFAGAPVLELRDVARSYGRDLALAPVSLTIGPGAVALVVGPNGAGKTTLLRVAAGLLRPTAGTRRCAGGAVYLRPGSGARPTQRVRDAVAFAAALAGSGADVAGALELAGLVTVADRRVGALSAGQRARLCLALAAATAPALACLDEPTAALDEDGRERTRAVVAALAQAGTAVLLATHDAVLAAHGWDARVRLDAGAVSA